MAQSVLFGADRCADGAGAGRALGPRRRACARDASLGAGQTASLLLHALLCRIARIDVDTFLVTSVSAICSPAFVPLVARSLGNRTVLLSGVTTGIIGYAIGTHLGTALGLLLARWG